MTDLTAKEIVFKTYLEKAIKKSRFGFIDYTNKELAERFEFAKKKYSQDSIEVLIKAVRQYFDIKGNTKRRRIYLTPDSISITQRLPYDSPKTTLVLPVDSPTITPSLPPDYPRIPLKSNPNPLEPQGLEDLLNDSLSISVLDPVLDPDPEIALEKNTKKEKPLESKSAVSTVSTLFSKDDVLFEEAYQAHRLGEHKGRSSRDKSWKKWKVLKREKALPDRETILKAIKIYREANPDSQYRQSFQAFLNSKPWLDIEDVDSLDDIRRQIREKFEREKAEYEADPEKWQSNHMSWSHAA